VSSNEKKKTYSKEFKEEAIRLVKEDGLTCIQMERDLNGVQREFRDVNYLTSQDGLPEGP